MNKYKELDAFETLELAKLKISQLGQSVGGTHFDISRGDEDWITKTADEVKFLLLSYLEKHGK